MSDLGVWTAKDVKYVKQLDGDMYGGDADEMIGTAGQTLIICEDAWPIETEDKDAFIPALYAQKKRELYKAQAENAKLCELVSHLMYVKPKDVNAILYKGKLLRFDDLLAEVGLRWESEVES